MLLLQLHGGSSPVDPSAHYRESPAPVEHEDLEECAFQIRNIGWTLGNDCPYRCTHCYSLSARAKGRDMEHWMIDRIVDQLVRNQIETVNLGGNEPLFTNGIDPYRSLLPYIIDRLTDSGILVGLTTAGITLTYLAKHSPEAILRLNDVDVSFDSPYEEEHNRNRGARLFGHAIQALEIARQYGIPRTIILCGMAWNFTRARLRDLVKLAKRFDAHLRINPLKTVEPGHIEAELSPAQYYEGFQLLMELCDPIDVGEPPLAAITGAAASNGCPCGRSSFRIHSITPVGTVPVSPCVYLHDYKTGDLLVEELSDIIRSRQFRAFRQRNHNPHLVPGCVGCHLLHACRGGCAARSYLTHLHQSGERSLFVRDPYCPRDVAQVGDFPAARPRHTGQRLVHQDYLCTWIGRPKVT